MAKKDLCLSSDKVSLEGNAKETFADRLMHLVGNGSVRAAAKKWGLSYSTLNNYLTRGTIPALNVAQSIARIEGVSLEWLATGGDNKAAIVIQQPVTNAIHVAPAHLAGLFDMMDILSEEEANKVLRVFKKKGMDTLLDLTDEINLELISLPLQVKKIAVLLKSWPPEKLREISADLEGSEHGNSPVTMQDSNQKKAV